MGTSQGGGSRVGTQFGPYHLRALIGRGGMGEVYEAFDTVRNRTVAVKLLPPHTSSDPDYLRRFRRESQIAARLQEPHIIPIHDFGEIDGTLFIDMRLVRGEDLRGPIRREGTLDPGRAVAIITQIAAALDAAHADGLVHRDVKPENILLDTNDFAYLVDFGIASSDTDSRLTATGMTVGSYAYMAPERFDAGTVTAAVDTYALGCVLYECLTGQKPYPRETISALIAAHLQAPPPRPSLAAQWVPPAVDEVIAHALAKDPARRFPSAGALAVAAKQAVATRPAAPAWRGHMATAQAPSTSGPQPWPATAHQRFPATPQAQPRQHKTRPVVLALVGVAVVAAAAVGGWMVLKPHNGATGSSTAGTTTGAPSSTPEVELAVGIPMSYPECDGTGIVVLASATTPGSYTSEVSAALAANPGASYLRTDHACPSLRQSLDGNPIYAVYRVAGTTQPEVCAAVAAAGGEAYGKWLDVASDPTHIVSC